MTNMTKGVVATNAAAAAAAAARPPPSSSAGRRNRAVGIMDLALELLRTTRDDDDDDRMQLAAFLQRTKQHDEGDGDGDVYRLTTPRSSSGVPPLLDQATTCSEDGDDDSSSVSSISTEEGLDGSYDQRRRSIFQRYWETHGGALRAAPITTKSTSSQLHCSKVAPTTQSTSFSDSCLGMANHTYEQMLRDSQITDDKTNALPQQQSRSTVITTTPTSPTRRTIFAQQSMSQSSFCLLQELAHQQQQSRGTFRKAYSASELEQRRRLLPAASCLRECRYSTGGNMNCAPTLRRCASVTPPPQQSDPSSSNSLSVRFNDQVDVRVFDKPAERWAASGWSDWFA